MTYFTWWKNSVKKFFTCFQDQFRKSQEVSPTWSMNKDKKLYHFQNAGHYGPPHPVWIRVIWTVARGVPTLDSESGNPHRPAHIQPTGWARWRPLAPLPWDCAADAHRQVARAWRGLPPYFSGSHTPSSCHQTCCSEPPQVTPKTHQGWPNVPSRGQQVQTSRGRGE